jgi:hypothetical protein
MIRHIRFFIFREFERVTIPLLKMGFLRSHASHFSAALLSACLVAPTASAVDGAGKSGVAGGWDIALADTNRRCTLQLREEATDAGHVIAMPAGCRRAMPILSDVDAWTFDGQRVAFADRGGETVLQFAAKSDRFFATGPEGETYELAAPGQLERDQPQLSLPESGTLTRPRVAPGMMAQAQTQTQQQQNRSEPAQGFRQQAPASRPANTPQRQPAAATSAIRPADMAGRYAILREEGRDTLCMLTLDANGRGPRGTLRAQLAPACRDQGIVVFDPVGWQIDRNRLALTARKGHKAHFELAPDGSWQKDPKEGGRALGFRKM